MPRAISLKKKNLVALDKALSPLSSQVLGLGNLKPWGHTAWLEPPVLKYSVEAAAGLCKALAAENIRMLMMRAAGGAMVPRCACKATLNMVVEGAVKRCLRGNEKVTRADWPGGCRRGVGCGNGCK